MTNTDCRLERISHIMVGFFLLLTASGFFIIGITVLPFLGIMVAIPVVVLAALFLRVPRSKECLIQN